MLSIELVTIFHNPPAQMLSTEDRGRKGHITKNQMTDRGYIMQSTLICYRQTGNEFMVASCWW